MDGHDEPGDIATRVRHVALVQVDRHRAPVAQDDVLRDVAAMAGASVHGAERGRRGLQSPEQQLTLAGERLAEAGDLVAPRRKAREFAFHGRRLAEPRSDGMEARQPLPAARGRRGALRDAPVENRLPGRRPRHLLFHQHAPRAEVREGSRNRERGLSAEAGAAYGVHGR